MTDTVRSPEFLIDVIFPSREVHLIGGPSGGGKSTLTFQIMLDWQDGKDVFGYHTHPVPWVYISTDRSESGVVRVLERMRIDPARIPLISTLGLPEDKAAGHIAAGLAAFPNARLLVIEGMSGLSPETSKSANGGYQGVRRFLGALSKLCQVQDLTIIGVVHSPKMKDDSRYSNPRQRVMGSVAWAAYTETILLVEEFKGEDAAHKDDRTLIVLPRNAPSQYINLRFESGRLVAWEDELDNVFIEEFLSKIGSGNTFTTAIFCDTLAKHMSEPTAKRRLKELETSGRIVRTGRGVYKVSIPQ